MIKRLFATTIALAVIAALFFFSPGVMADTTTLGDYAGIAAYTNIEATIDLEALKSAFVMIEYQDPLEEYFVGTLDLPGYEDVYNPLVLVTADGNIVAFYLNTDPAAKIVDIISKNLDETLLEKAINMVVDVLYPEPEESEEPEEPVERPTFDISFYDFGNPNATTMLLVAEYQPDGNTFTLQFDAIYVDEFGVTQDTNNIYHAKSYAFYRTFAPSFTLDNDTIDQVDFVEANADFIGAGYYGTIYGHFATIDFVPEELNSFAVEAGDGLGFGVLAIEYSGDSGYTAADKDYENMINLVPPSIDPAIDLTPSAFGKVSPGVDEADVVLNPTLSWEESTVPNYEYCIDDSAPGSDPEADDCSTGWISTNETSVQLSDLFYETTYYWQVRAINSFGEVEANGETWWSFTTADGVAPAAFDKVDQTLKEPVDSLSKVTMTWEASYGAYYYEVCVDTAAACTAPEYWHNVGLATTATIGDLLLDSTYYWQVRAWNGFDLDGNDDAGYYTYAGGETNWNSFDTRTFGKLRPVDNEVYNLTLPFKWEETPIADDNGYEYCIDQTNDGVCGTELAPQQWSKIDETSVVINTKKEKLDAGTYYWQVRVKNSAGEYVYADPGNDELGNPLPTGEWWKFEVLSRKDLRNISLFKESPMDSAIIQDISDLELTWRATGTISDYQYCYFPVDDTDTTPISDDDTCTDLELYEDNWTSVGTDLTTGAVFSDLLPGTTYYWQVRGNLEKDDEADPIWLYADKGAYWAFTTITE